MAKKKRGRTREELIAIGKATQFKKGNTIATGRPKKIDTILKEQGLSITKKDLLEVTVRLSVKTISELQDIIDDDESPAIMVTIANAFIESKSKGLREIDKLIPYILGAVKQEMEISKPKSKLEERIEELKIEHPEKDYSELEDLAMQEIEDLINKKPNE